MNISTTVSTHTIEIKNSLGAAITAIEGMNVYDLECIRQWGKYFPVLNVSGNVQLPEEGGIRWNRTKNSPPTLDECLRAYIMGVPGNKLVMIALPTFELADGVGNLLKHAQDNRMELAWAAYVTMPGDATPTAFFVTGAALGHMLNNIPNQLPFSGTNWAAFVHDWMTQNMFAHRYFDASAMGVIPVAVEAPVSKTPVLTSTEAAKARKNNWTGF